MIRHGWQRKPVNEVCIHTSATPGNWYLGMYVEDMVAEIRRWHVDMRGWRDIGYHRVISPQGEVGLGRSIYKTGAGVLGHNVGVVHICLVPVQTHNGIKSFGDYFTDHQRVALVAYIRELMELTPITRITGHNQYAAKECPGFRVDETGWLQRLVV